MRKAILPLFGALAMMTWSCSDQMQDSVEGNQIEALSAAGGNGNGNAYGLLRNCSSNDVLNRQLNQNPGMARKMQLIEEHTARFVNGKKPDGSGGGKPGGGSGGGGDTPTPYTGTVTIPVYVHVLYNTAQENISQAQIDSQIRILNEDFGATNSDLNPPAEFAGVVADSEIQFVLADVTYKQSSKTSWGTNDAMKKSSQGGIDPITPDKALNIWVCNIGNGILGYAQFPGGSPDTDGVVIGTPYFGDTGYVSAPFDKGRTGTHEVGHWLNLRHIWGDGRCRADDFVADTPTSDRSNYGCPSYPTEHCRSNDMTMNYMDYTNDECMYMFTEGQKARMRALFAAGGVRESIVL